MTLSGNSQWNHAASNPITDVQAMLRRTVRRPNVLVFGALSWDAFRAHEKTLRAISGATLTQGATTSGGLATEAQVAALFRVADVVIGEAKYDTEEYLSADTSLEYIWGKHVAAVYRHPGQMGPKTVSFATRFQQQVMQVESAYDVKRRSDYLSVSFDEDLKIIANDLGALLRNVVA